ncbi:MAG: NAD-dependent malic enzyme [Candidatus Nealsonbacteria bacterium CG_4_10_14_0_2_um_filter_37_10]|uniref:NAD-dependent malic enzyme n=3 Tax=Candidatus Nealsoniibacteriota TaxID=1817911 RepID=A0A2H0TJ10_9BACT|nr:MAG: NAD-dependent malic enzyme [Candidatus Nealsonbacteria bacterium CG10_big_fil_rev_8_21_14_0_10_37_25]PIZ89464.1 MAG: NAD-dependent malic enzyme [Candidatus Nealsonbacteria bacterium CG_4_10_14_0_2_um_filter_37_10]PJA84939.1 MAG: NAD-dependent malic enzyme [Candidatus Nealsonbacteria bacterium CG_4_9_14_3_um_filter_37_13]
MNKALNLHKKLKGKIEIRPKIRVSKRNLHLVYTPGVAEVAKEISRNPAKSFEYTSRGNNVAIITDGSRTLGVGNTIPEAALPVIEGKALFSKALAGIDAYPIALRTKSKKEIIRTIEILSPNFAAFNIEDIKSPKSLEIMEELRKKDLILFHDDEEGVAIVVLATLFNALRVVGKKLKEVRICLAGAGTAGYGIFKILNYAGLKNLLVYDAKGIIFRGRKGDNKYLKEIAKLTNRENLKGSQKEAIEGSDVFIGVTGCGNLLNSSDIKLMQKNPIIFALSNPVPEIFPKKIKKVTQNYILATGRSDFPNQINNLIVFPGILRGLLDSGRKMNLALEFKIAKSITSLIKKPRPNYIIPSPFDKRLVKTIVNCLK